MVHVLQIKRACRTITVLFALIQPQQLSTNQRPLHQLEQATQYHTVIFLHQAVVGGVQKTMQWDKLSVRLTKATVVSVI